MIISPSNESTHTIAGIKYSGNCVLCSFKERNELFREIVKNSSLRWSYQDGLWKRKLNIELNGKPEHRAAELAAALINSGFICNVGDDIADLVKSALWDPEQRRWVLVIGDRFHLLWSGEDENLYRMARTLPESMYDHDNKTVSVSAIYYTEVVGFAEEHNFQFTNEAKEYLKKAELEYTKNIFQKVEIPQPKKVSKKIIKPGNLFYLLDNPMHNIKTTTNLYDHQKKAVDKLLPIKVGALFMDMGTGKTRCAIELASLRQQRITKVIWFTPVSLKITVSEEIKKHTVGESICVFDNKTNYRNVDKNAFWYIVGIESMSSSNRIISAIEKIVDSDTMIIVDESSYIKGYSALRTMRIIKLSERARYRLLLTGTPISQGISDLYSQMKFLSPDILGYGSFYSFARQHLEYSEKHPGLIVRSNDVDVIAERIAPYTYQVTKEECFDLPQKIYDSVYFGLTDEQHAAYVLAKHEILDGILDDKIPDYMIFQLFTALQQIVSGFWNHNGTMINFKHDRIKTMKEVIGEIHESDKIIIWCKFVESVKKISKSVPGCALYYGELNEKKRSEELRRFIESDCRYLVATTSCGGHGLTINEARYHIFYENEFKYSNRIQAEDRSHRIGQTKPVTYIDIVANAGIDRRIQEALSKKQDVVQSFKSEVNKAKGLMEL